MSTLIRSSGWIPAVVLCALAGCSTVAPHGSPDRKKLVLRGVVTSIFIANTSYIASWGVTLQVEAVETGTYDRPEFTFTVHSPAMSGLEVGEHYTVVATETKTGYAIDPDQWMERHEAK